MKYFFEVGYSDQYEPSHYGYFSSIGLALKKLETMKVKMEVPDWSKTDYWSSGNYYIRRLEMDK